MNILHYEHMGVGCILSNAMNKLGHHSEVFSHVPHPFGFKADREMQRWMNAPVLRKAFEGLALRRYLHYDVVHCHDPNGLPAWFEKRTTAGLFQHYHDPHTERPVNNYRSFVSLPMITTRVPKATWLPLPVDTEYFRRIKHEIPFNEIVIGYCDQKTDPRKEWYIPKPEIERLASELSGLIILKPLASIIPHSKIKQYYETLDVWVDRYGLDTYGFAAIEAASMEVYVISDYDKSLVPDSCPFGTFAEPMSEQILHAMKYRIGLGLDCREYVQQYHNDRKIARQCLDVYRDTLGSGERKGSTIATA